MEMQKFEPKWHSELSLALSAAEMMGILMRTRAALLSAVEELVSSGVQGAARPPIPLLLLPRPLPSCLATDPGDSLALSLLRRAATCIRFCCAGAPIVLKVCLLRNIFEFQTVR